MVRDIDRLIARRIRSRRRLMGMTLQQLAERCGTNFQTVQKYELGVTRVSAPRLWRISQVLEVDINFFFDPPDEAAARGGAAAARPHTPDEKRA